MEGFKYVDIFATKGLEYLIVIGFLVTLVLFWRALNKPAVAAANTNIAQKIKTTLIDWFYLADDFYYHQGHSWVMPVNSEMVVIGVDDFTQKLLGTPDNIQLPKIGANIRQGEQGWKLQFNETVIDVLSPINGEVMEINSALLNNPELANGDPYQKGWLLKVKPSKLSTDLKNLLSGALARAWIEDNVNKLSARMTGNSGIVLQDGGLPVSGFAREISREHWDDLAREFLLTKNLN